MTRRSCGQPDRSRSREPPLVRRKGAVAPGWSRAGASPPPRQARRYGITNTRRRGVTASAEVTGPRKVPSGRFPQGLGWPPPPAAARSHPATVLGRFAWATCRLPDPSCASASTSAPSLQCPANPRHRLPLGRGHSGPPQLGDDLPWRVPSTRHHTPARLWLTVLPPARRPGSECAGSRTDRSP